MSAYSAQDILLNHVAGTKKYRTYSPISEPTINNIYFEKVNKFSLYNTVLKAQLNRIFPLKYKCFARCKYIIIFSHPASKKIL